MSAEVKTESRLFDVVKYNSTDKREDLKEDYNSSSINETSEWG